jgi:hypothetical protein
MKKDKKGKERRKRDRRRNDRRKERKDRYLGNERRTDSKRRVGGRRDDNEPQDIYLDPLDDMDFDSEEIENQ